MPTAPLTEFRPPEGARDSGDEGSVAGEVVSDVARPDFPQALKLALRPYLGDGYPDVNLAAQIAGTSARTLQRRLMRVGLSYRTLVREMRDATKSEARSGDASRSSLDHIRRDA